MKELQIMLTKKPDTEDLKMSAEASPQKIKRNSMALFTTMYGCQHVYNIATLLERHLCGYLFQLCAKGVNM